MPIFPWTSTAAVLLQTWPQVIAGLSHCSLPFVMHIASAEDVYLASAALQPQNASTPKLLLLFVLLIVSGVSACQGN